MNAMMLPLDVKRLERKVSEVPASVFACSFDVFNTLIERKIEPPDATKLPAAHRLRELCNTRSTVEELFASRMQLEYRMGQRAEERGFDAEFRLADLFVEWAQLWMGRKPLQHEVDSLIKAEMTLELDVVRAVKGVESVLDKLQASGKRLFFLSDMYLERTQIQALLNQCGLAHYFEDGLASGDCGLSKRSGRLFKHAAERWGLSLKDMLHIGDDLLADVQMPACLGMQAYWFRDPQRERRLQVAKSAIRLGQKCEQARGGHHVQQVVEYSYGNGDRNRDTYYRIGLEVVGPVLMNFIHSLACEARDDGVDLLAFAAREGFVLGDLYERLRKSGDASLQGIPNWVYAYVSRKSTYGAALRGFGDWERTLGAFTHEPTVGKFLRRFSIGDCVSQAQLEAFGFTGFDDLIDVSDGRLAALFSDPEFQNRVQAKQQNAVSLLRRYMRQLGVFGAARPALVDLGWYGSIQAAINRALTDDNDWPGLRGFYLALWHHPVLRDPHNPSVKALLFDESRHHKRFPVMRFPELLEMATRAPHATTVGYRENEGAIEPVLRSHEHPARKAEVSDNAYVSGLQAGLFDYADAYVSLLGTRSGPAKVETPYVLQNLDRLVRYPDAEEARALLSFSHSEDAGNGLIEQAGNFRSLIRGSGRVLWPEGFWRRSAGPLGGLLYNGFRLMARRYY